MNSHSKIYLFIDTDIRLYFYAYRVCTLQDISQDKYQCFLRKNKYSLSAQTFYFILPGIQTHLFVNAWIHTHIIPPNHIIM